MCGCTTGRRTQYSSTLRRLIRQEPVQPAPHALYSFTKCRQVLPSESLITNDLCYTSSAATIACLNLWLSTAHLAIAWITIQQTRQEKTSLVYRPVSSIKKNTLTAHSIPMPCESVSPKDGDLNILDSSSLLVPAGSKSCWPRPDDYCLSLFCSLSVFCFALL